MSDDIAKNTLNAFTVKRAIMAFVGLILLCAVWGAAYTVPEGYVGIQKRFGEAIAATESGLRFKLPFADDVHFEEVRTRKYQIKLSVSTTGRAISEDGTESVELQMPSDVTISANWNIPKTAALEIYSEYGGLEQYEDRILDPRVIRSTKQVMAKYTIEEIISQREVVRGEIDQALTDALAGKLASMTDVNIEDINFSPKIKTAIQNKQTAKLGKEEQEYKLEQQELKAQETVNTAQADADAKRKAADAEAYRITEESKSKADAIEREGIAEAKAIKDKAAALKANQTLVEYQRALSWDGAMPKTIMGGNGNGVIWQMSK